MVRAGMARAKRRRRGRPAGGSAALIGEILCATLDQLCRAGYAELSVDAVARVAGVNKTTIYRRWPTKSELVIAAIVAAKTRALPFRPSGDLRRDLVALLDAKARRMATPRQRAIAYAINNLDPAVSEALVAELRRHRYTIPRDIIEHAIASGELPRDVDAELLAELLCAPICHRALVMCEPVPKKFVEQTVAIVLAGVRAQRRTSITAAPSKRPARRSSSASFARASS
jgi:AcrR family transcriptional regulator